MRTKKETRLILIFDTDTNCENMAYRSFRSEKCSARGVRTITTGITGLWQPSVPRDVAFGSFDLVLSAARNVFHLFMDRERLKDALGP